MYSVPVVRSEIFGSTCSMIHKFLPALNCGSYMKETEHLHMALPFVHHIVLIDYLDRTF